MDEFAGRYTVLKQAPYFQCKKLGNNFYLHFNTKPTFSKLLQSEIL